MKVIPALDLLNGKCVRLYQGQYQKQQIYNLSAIDILQNYQRQGACQLHLVDLEGAKNPDRRQWKIIQSLIEKVDVPIQMGGGVRSLDDALLLYESGVSQVIVGSMAIHSPEETQALINRYPQTILGADLRPENGEFYVATHGWTQNSKIEVNDFIRSFKNLRYVLSTDITKDGTMTSPNFSLYQNLQKQFPDIHFIASGGVSSLSDLKRLRDLDLYAVVIGKALLEGQFSFEEASR
ncbi:MAG: 1-(5-phosphoribosyl)-5-[(5-phosphoribosylamino)methylideneamino]imidazole-4-carboxamide isomerase, partial [Pseudomonadota bacterium]